MQEKSTDELDAQLRNTTPDCMDKYYKENRYYIAETSKAFTRSEEHTSELQSPQ